MARHILERNPGLSYEGLDFSEVFFDVARETIGRLLPRTPAAILDPGLRPARSKAAAETKERRLLPNQGTRLGLPTGGARCRS